MKKTFRIILKIITPAVCILTALSMLLPVISLEGLQNNNSYLRAADTGETDAAISTRQFPEAVNKLPASETFDKSSGGIFDICRGGRLSSLDLIRLYPKVKGEAVNNYPEFYRKLCQTVEKHFVLLLLVMSGMLFLLLLTALFSVLTVRRGFALTAFVSGVINIFVTLGYILSLNTVVMEMRMGSAPVITGMIALTVSGAVITAVLSWMVLLVSCRHEDAPEDATVLTGYIGMPVSQNEDEKPCVCCLTGKSKGLTLPVGVKKPLIIGRTGEEADLVISSEAVSRKHCSVVYDDYRRMYAVTDWSQNGTYTEKGYRLLKGYAGLFPDGTVLYLSNSENAVRLGRG